MIGRGRYRVPEIDDLTLAEVALALDDDPEDDRPRGGVSFGSAAEMQAYAERRRNMTAAERLAGMRERWEDA